MFSCHCSDLEGGSAAAAVVVACGVLQAQNHAAAVEPVAVGRNKAGTVAGSTLAMGIGYTAGLEERDGGVDGEVAGLAVELSIFLR